jgi:hypothetical protein
MHFTLTSSRHYFWIVAHPIHEAVSRDGSNVTANSRQPGARHTQSPQMRIWPHHHPGSSSESQRCALTHWAKLVDELVFGFLLKAVYEGFQVTVRTRQLGWRWVASDAPTPKTRHPRCAESWAHDLVNGPVSPVRLAPAAI